MKKSKIMFWVTLLVLIVNSVSFGVIVYHDDGGSYLFNDNSTQYDWVYLDEFVANSPGTHADMVDGGSTVRLYGNNTATIDMSGGSTGIFQLNGNASATISGGTIISSIQAYDNSTIAISGGNLPPFNIKAYDNATIYLEGTGFEIGGNSLVDGDKVSDFAASNGNYYSDTLSGTLADGTYFSAIVQVWNTGDFAGTGDIIIGTVPEPATMCLLGLGGLMLRRRRS